MFFGWQGLTIVANENSSPKPLRLRIPNADMPAPPTPTHLAAQTKVSADGERSDPSRIDELTPDRSASREPASVIVADDHPVVAQAVTKSLDAHPSFRVTATVGSGRDLLYRLDSNPCELVVTDLCMHTDQDAIDGLPLIDSIRRKSPDLKVVVFTIISNAKILLELRRAGVVGIVGKGDPLEILVKICERVVFEEGFFSSARITEIIGPPEQDSPDDGARLLSGKELEIIRLAAAGLSLTQIASRLHRTRSTISNHKRSAMRKLGVRTDVDLLRFAMRAGLWDGWK